MTSLQRSGKTAPRLVQDIHEYDPSHPPGTGRNLLSDVPPVYPEHYHGPPLDSISPSACRHHYVTKTSQSYLPRPDQANTGTSVKVSAICSECRYHLQVGVSSDPGIGHTNHALPNHIHHFVFNSGRHGDSNSPAEVTAKGQAVDTFYYECSYLTCPVSVHVRVVSPILNDGWVKLLTDSELLHQRAEEAIAAHPTRLEGIATPLPINVLLNLRAYINNALHDTQQSKSISAINKRFMSCFGVEGKPCKDLLEFLGFTVKNEGFWEPPRPNAWAEFPYRDPLKIFLDDVIHELTLLIQQRPLAERKGHQLEFTYHPVKGDLLNALGSLEYPKALRFKQFQMPPAPYYEDLGVVEDMSSSSIIEAFHRQVSVDPARASTYLNCLKSIGSLRGGDDENIIDRAVQLAYAEGKYTDEDVIEAYKYFGLSPEDTRLTDDSIIGKFYAFLSATTQETETRRQLWRIGDNRRSERIKAAAEERVSTVEQAHIFLGVDDKTSDDFIITMYTAKVDDSPTSKDLATRAVGLIAESRKSDALKYFIKTGEMTTGEMDVADAYRLLQIPDRTADEAAIMAAYTICVDEAPAQAEKYNQALRMIAQDKNSPILSGIISGPAATSDRNVAEWPVGLQNIGNTCYLNSLLQFYFSVRPFRDMVLDFESFKMDLTEESLSKKQVGSRKVMKKEVERSQWFLRELRNLFHNMINSSESCVTPGQQLARLTLISPSNEAAIRRRSTISASRPAGTGLGEVDGMPVLGPLGPPQSIVESGNRDTAATEIERLQRSTVSDVDSELTLVSDGPKNDPSATHHDDKENNPPTDTVMTDVQEKPTSEAIESGSQPTEKTPPPSSQPPPVPPRPTVQPDPERQLREEVEIGAQQDVTEVINNVLFQSQCAIRPISLAPDGEQLDQVKDLFYGQAKSYILSGKGVRSKEEWWCDIKVDVATGSRDIYAAIDGAFDVQKVNVEDSVAEQYSAISKLPPVLQIQVQRVQFDPVKKRSFKSTHHLDLKDTIYLDRYMDTQQPEILARRRQCWEWKKKLKLLEGRRNELLRKSEADGLDMPSLFNSARDMLKDLESLKDDPDTANDAIYVNPELPSDLGRLAQIARTELDSIDQEMKDTQTMISSQFTDYKHLAYRLYAVFVHHGSVSFGHYYIYIFDFERNVWRKYNDEYVTEVQDLDEIFSNQDRANPPTPYFLVYVNDMMKTRLVNPLHRIVQEPPPLPDDRADATPTEVVVPLGSEDVDMNPPAYDEIVAEKDAPGTGDDHYLAGKEKMSDIKDGQEAVAGGWKPNTNTDSGDVHW
ncbi:ubiquitin-specific protease ubp2 [Aspergillus nanangensis]|uniref:ubiquitinyl hydrolase 1 n=1 Tax=Aspergillus nanangensis TaxID=2582783 RepID=A0AAD4GMV3_ASPNN|nr:ubiquitin-specific protease ubp2 [Aspergillus nanangensis]